MLLADATHAALCCTSVWFSLGACIIVYITAREIQHARRERRLARLYRPAEKEKKTAVLHPEQVDDYMDFPGTIVIANPNAPTGMTVSRADIQRLLEADPNRVVIVDEAYVDFGAESCVPMIYRYDNLLVVQTMSKSRSLAGGRVGFALGSPELISALNRVKYSFNPYNVGRLSIVAGAAAVEDEDYFQTCTAAIRNNRAWTVRELEALGFSVLPSQANFIFAKSDKIPGGELYRKLKENGILVRWFDADRIRDYVRITIGSLEQMASLVDEVARLLEEV